MAQIMGNQGGILGYDIAPDRLKLVQENCTRLGVTCVQFACSATGDAPVTQPLPSDAALPFAPFDRILVDAPCSNTGVMRRRIDLRWRIRPEEIQRLGQTQLVLLERAASLLKPNGVIVYSTCSLEPEENQAVVNQFLESHAGFSLQNQRELSPFADAVDGAYVARLHHGA